MSVMPPIGELAAAFRRDGHVVMPMMDAATLQALRRWLDALPPAAPAAAEGFRCRDQFVIGTGHRIVRQWRGDVEPLARFVRSGGQLALLHELLGSELRCCYDQFIIKLPGDSGFDWHQDNESWQMDPDDNITTWTAIDDVDLDNGCLWMVPGSHRTGLLPKIEGRFAPQLLARARPVAIPAGHGIAFSGYAVHGSRPNASGRPRRALLLQYCRASTRIAMRPIDSGVPGTQFVAGLSPVIRLPGEF